MSGLQQYWYRLTPLHLILYPLSLLFASIVALRRWLYRRNYLSSQRLPVPVIVIGNISVGGTGKTPLTLALTQQLIEHGYHPLIISRGYGGVAEQTEVSPHSDPLQVGDEPVLMAQRQLCPVWVGRDRVATAQTALQAHADIDVILSDDGLQHYRLQRDVEIAVVDGVRGTGNGLLLPAGPLREPIARLQSVDALVINGTQAQYQGYAMRLVGEIFYNLLHPEKIVTAAQLQGLNLHALAGIGYPQRYFDQLAQMGLKFIPHAFPDHHPYVAKDLQFAPYDALLLTEKDAVKCGAYADEKFWVLRVEAQIDPALCNLILRKLSCHGRKTT